MQLEVNLFRFTMYGVIKKMVAFGLVLVANQGLRFARNHKEGEVVGKLQLRHQYDRESKELHIIRHTIDRSRLYSFPMSKLRQLHWTKPTMS